VDLDPVELDVVLLGEELLGGRALLRAGAVERVLERGDACAQRQPDGAGGCGAAGEAGVNLRGRS